MNEPARRRGALSHVFLIVALTMGAASLPAGTAHAIGPVNLTTLGAPYTQDFTTLPTSGSATWTNNSTIPGWFHARTGTGTTIVANDGSSNAGNLYSYGTGTATDRALGSLGSGNAAVGNLFWGVRLFNQTGSTITSLGVSYTGEQWRNSAAAAQTVTFSYLVGSPTVTGSLAEFQSAGVAVSQLDFTSPVTGGSISTLDGNLAANQVFVSFTITGLNIPPGTDIMLRWSDPDHTGADHGLAIDTVSITPFGVPVLPSLSIGDVTLAEGDPPGTTTFTFPVTLSAPAGPGGVTFDIATADGAAQDDNPASEDNDYVAQSLTGQSIPAGSTGPYNFSVTVNRDTVAEPNQTFFVNVTSITGATAGDTQGQGTITNDDATLTPIHDIQGPGSSSPIVGATITTRGIVTGVKNNGFFIQEPDATVDADPATSEGILVFTSGAPPAAATVGSYVQVTGTVSEFVPSIDPLQPPLTELTSPTVVQLSTGNPLPAPIPLTASFPDPAGPHDQLERLEGMRASLASLTVVGPTLGLINEANATATSTGVFYGVVTGVARPFREAGIQAPDPPPSGVGSIPPIPRFDANPERIRVDSDGLVGGPLIDVGTGAVVTGLVGPVDYTMRAYTLLPDPGAALGVVGGPTVTAATAPSGQEFTVASFDLQRFYDTVDDAGVADSVLTPAAFDRRLSKASLAIRNSLQMPDIVGLAGVENLTTLQSLAARISADAIAAAQPDPQYVAYLVEGNDIGSMDVAFLVKTAPVFGTTPRVAVVEVAQELDGTLFVNPDSSTELLNDRPPLRLTALVNHPNGASFPVTVIANNLRTLSQVNSENPGSSGWPTEGARVRAKRLKQAEDLANLVQARQTSDPAERIILLGNFNAFEFNDGFADLIGVIAGTPPPDNETAVPGDGVDLVNPNLDNLFDTAPPAERYSHVPDGNAQNLDHILANAPLIAGTVAHRIEHARIGADFPETSRNDPTTPVRLAERDPLLAYFQVAGFATADLSVTKSDAPDPVAAGANLTYTITANNAGPDPAEQVSVSDTLPAGTTFVSLAAPGGWSCTTPAVGAGGTVTCSNPTLAVGSAVFTLVVQVDAGVAHGTALSNTATATSTTADPNPGNQSATATTTVFDATPPTVTINQAAGQPDPALISPISFTVIFSEPVSGFGDSPADVAISGTAGATTAAIVETGPMDGTTYTVGISGMTATGTVVASIPAEAAQDLAGNLSAASTSTDNTVTFAPVVPVVTGIVRAGPDPTNAASVQFSVTFSEDVSGVDAGDFALAANGVTGASVTGVSGSGTTWTVTVSTGSGDGSLRLDLTDDDSIVDGSGNPLGGGGPGNGGFSSGELYTVDKTAPTAGGLVAADVTGAGGATYTFTLVLSDNLAVDVASLGGDDIRVSGPGGFSQLATLVSVVPATDGTPRTATYQISAPGGAWDAADSGVYSVALEAGQVRDTAGNAAAGGGLGTFSVTIDASGFAAYLPLVLGQPTMPDLTASISISPSKASFSAGEPVVMTVTITNRGAAPAGPFWVDLYINPSSPPTEANQIWNTRCGLAPCFGMAWAVPNGLAPGESITLTSQSVAAGYSIWPGWFAAGTSDIYVFADSYNPAAASGAVAESDEANNRAELRGLSVTGANPSVLQTQPVPRQRPWPLEPGR